MLFSGSVCGLGGAQLHSPFFSSPNGKITCVRCGSFWCTATMLDATVSLPRPFVCSTIQSPRMLGASEVVWPSCMGLTTQLVSCDSFFVCGSQK